ncbi:hypothetical protein Mal4_00950 [Maioricimonas rarisocia]|uniref:Cytochrome b561 bacterial/Ni-hydrogenase domain-containing protein n=1 Tax=Maioricimonas rarisocia TaxID=2528026 RepID=A0A517Z047_9PLAN|nr:hypothetical protein [Maioricimonas rarisocia]QDU35813.1 hypothetical protein Mal4_00950 [Maioricimonas rarisocia]
MNRIFLTLATIGNLSLVAAFVCGWQIGDAGSLSETARQAVSLHFLVAIGAGLLAMLVHAVALTYFMGTGRWIEETSEAYGLGAAARKQNIRLKYRALPGMIACILLIIVTGAFGAIADPASNTSMAGASTIHFTLATLTILANFGTSWFEYSAIEENGRLVNEVIGAARQIRRDKGLDTPAEPSSTQAG